MSYKNLALGDDHNFSLLGELNADPVWNSEGEYWNFEVNHKGDSPFECFVFTGDFEPINRLSTLQEVVIGWYMRDDVEIQNKLVLRSGAHVQGNIPVAGLDYLYYMDEKGDAIIATTQGQVAYNNEHALVCVNVDFGYRKSFNKVFTELVDSWETNSKKVLDPYYREVYIVSLEEYSVGFVDLSYSKDSDGDTVYQDVTSFMIRPDPLSVQTSDNYHLEYSTPDGYLINAYTYEVSNDELEKSLSLNFTDKDGWVVEGTMNGKSVTFDLGDDDYPVSSLGHHQISKSLLTEEEGATAEYLGWVESADPSKFMKTTLELTRKDTDNNQILVGIGPLKINANVNDSGAAKSFGVRVGDLQMNYYLEVSEGAIE